MESFKQYILWKITKSWYFQLDFENWCWKSFKIKYTTYNLTTRRFDFEKILSPCDNLIQNWLRFSLIFFGLASLRSYKIGVVGNNWLVGNAVSSETALRIFLIFCIKLGDYKGRKVTAGFLKKILDLEIFVKTSPN